MNAQLIWRKWSKGAVDVLERAPHRQNRILLPTSVRSVTAAIAAAIAHSTATGRRVILILDSLHAVFVDKGRVVVTSGDDHGGAV
jgi:hypothetical protein